jgi:hypothetical protein
MMLSPLIGGRAALSLAHWPRRLRVRSACAGRFARVTLCVRRGFRTIILPSLPEARPSKCYLPLVAAGALFWWVVPLWSVAHMQT